jgi:hypothetical protein
MKTQIITQKMIEKKLKEISSRDKTNPNYREYKEKEDKEDKDDSKTEK